MSYPTKFSSNAANVKPMSIILFLIGKSVWGKNGEGEVGGRELKNNCHKSVNIGLITMSMVV